MAQGLEFVKLVFLFVCSLSFLGFLIVLDIFHLVSFHGHLIVCLLFIFLIFFLQFNCCSCFSVFTTNISCIDKLLECPNNVG